MHRVRQFFGHLRARVTTAEQADALTLVPPAAADLFAAMPVADRRHALDVVAHLRDAGHDDPDLLAAALLHDAAKGHRMRLWHRVGGVLLGAALPSLLARLADDRVDSWRYPFHLYLHHAELSARAARAAGCSERAAQLIRGTTEDDDLPALTALRTADEAS